MAKLLLKIDGQSLSATYDIPKIVENSINYLEYEVKIPEGNLDWEKCDSINVFFTGENGTFPPLAEKGWVPSGIIKSPGFAVTVTGEGEDYFVPTEPVIIQVFPNDSYNNVIVPPEEDVLDNWYNELLSASKTAINNFKLSAGMTLIELDEQANNKLDEFKNNADTKITEIESRANIAISSADTKITEIESRADTVIDEIENSANTKIIDLNQVDYDINVWELDEGTYIVLPDEDYEHYVYFSDDGSYWIAEGQFTLQKSSLDAYILCATGTGYILETIMDYNYHSFIYNFNSNGAETEICGRVPVEYTVQTMIEGCISENIGQSTIDGRKKSIAVGTFKSYVDTNINELSNMLNTSENLYNKMTNKIDTRFNEIQQLGWSVTDYIYLDIGTYALTYSTSTPIKRFNEIELYRLNKKRYSSYLLSNSIFFTEYKNENKVTFKIDEPSYVRFDGRTEEMSEIMLVKGTALPSEYVPYKNELKLDLLPTKNIVKTITESCNAWELEDGIYIMDNSDMENMLTLSWDGKNNEALHGIFFVYTSTINNDNKIIFAQYTDTGEYKNRIAWLCVDAEGTLQQRLDLTNQNGAGGNITIDNQMSDTSTNPVQNKVVKDYVDNKTIKTITESCNAWELENGIYSINVSGEDNDGVKLYLHNDPEICYKGILFVANGITNEYKSIFCQGTLRKEDKQILRGYTTRQGYLEESVGDDTWVTQTQVEDILNNLSFNRLSNTDFSPVATAVLKYYLEERTRGLQYTPLNENLFDENQSPFPVKPPYSMVTIPLTGTEEYVVISANNNLDGIRLIAVLDTDYQGWAPTQTLLESIETTRVGQKITIPVDARGLEIFYDKENCEELMVTVGEDLPLEYVKGEFETKLKDSPYIEKENLDITLNTVETNLKSYVDEVIGGIENGSY